MSEHTPGPWEWTKSERANVYTDLGSPLSDDVWSVLEAEDYYVCISDADARLIAAAPELLEALIDTLECYNNIGEISDVMWDKARAAITKARGKDE